MTHRKAVMYDTPYVADASCGIIQMSLEGYVLPTRLMVRVSMRAEAAWRDVL